MENTFLDSISALLAGLAFLAALATLIMQWRDRQIRLEIIQEAWWGADNQDGGGLPRFVVHNIGSKAINIEDVLVDTLPNVSDRDRREGLVATSMGVEEGKVPGWLLAGHHIRLNAYEGARVLRKHGLSGEVGTDLIVVDALDKERRYPITLKVEGENNEGEFDL